METLAKLVQINLRYVAVLALIFVYLSRVAFAQISGSESFSLEDSSVASAAGEMMSETFSSTSTLAEPTSVVSEMSSESFTATIGLLASQIPIAIDVIPGDPDNTINTRRRGRVPVAIFSSVEFDASRDIDLSSLTFGRAGDELSLSFCANDPEDLDEDGISDQICLFNAQATGLEVGDEEVVLRGLTSDGETNLVGIDAVNVPR